MYTVDELLSEYTKPQLVAMANYYDLGVVGKTKKEIAEELVTEFEKEEILVQHENVAELPKYSVRVKRIMESKNELV
jgi:uncharacterized protein with ATP-grasp and redox domains